MFTKNCSFCIGKNLYVKDRIVERFVKAGIHQYAKQDQLLDQFVFTTLSSNNNNLHYAFAFFNVKTRAKL